MWRVLFNGGNSRASSSGRREGGEGRFRIISPGWGSDRQVDVGRPKDEESSESVLGLSSKFPTSTAM